MFGRHVNGVVQAYTSQAIEAWKAETEQNPRDIAQYHQDIRAHQEQLGEQEPKLQQLVTQKIMPLDKKIQALQAQISVLTIPAKINDANLQISQHQNALMVLQPQFDSVMQMITPIEVDISRLHNFIALLEAQRQAADLNASIAHHHSAIDKHEHELHDLQHKLDDVNNHISSANSRLSSLQTQQSIDTAGHMAQAYDHHHHHHGHHHGQHYSFGASIVHSMGDAAVNMNIASLQSELRDLHRQRDALQSDMHAQQNKLREHQSEEECTHRKLEECQKSIAMLLPQTAAFNFSNNIAALRGELAQRQEARRPHEMMRNQLDGQIQKHKNEINYFREHIVLLNSEYNRALGLAGEFATNDNLDDLHSQVGTLLALRRQLGEEQGNAERLIAAYRQHIANAQNAITAKTRKQEELLSNQFMVKFRDQPDALVNEIADQIRACITSYEKSNPANQTENIRLCLADTISKLDVILAMPAGEAAATRSKYYYLCGMLCTMLEKIDVNATLAQQMMAILRNHPLDAEEAKAAYSTLKNVNPDLMRDMTSADLVYMQYAQYDAAYKYLQDTLEFMPDNAAKPWMEMCQRAHEVMTAVNVRKLKAVENGEPEFDVKYHTNVLHKTADLIRDPGNQQLQQEYHQLIEHNNDGKPSLTKKICGAMLMFLGAAVIIASVVLKVVSVGVAAPLTITGMVGGGVAFAAGLGLFGWGMRKGTSRKMDNFEKSVTRAAVTPLFKPAATVQASKSKLRSSDVDDEAAMLKANVVRV